MEFPLFVVYLNPRDFPRSAAGDTFVVRRQVARSDGEISADLQPLAVTGDLAAARRALPEGLVNIGRMPGDDPVIFEVWV